MIESNSLTKRFGDHVAVRDLTFTAPDGHVTGFLGPNGAGKTTSFRMLLGLAHPTAGQAVINGKPYAELTNPRRQVGALLESSGFHPGRSGRNHLRVVAAAASIPAARVDEVLGVVGLTTAGDRRVGAYSMGMRQRLALATSLLGDPQTLILDEPTNGLDPEGVAWLRSLLRHWASEGRCVVVASHLLAEMALAVDHVVIINNGDVVHQGPASEAINTAAVHVDCSDPVTLADLLTKTGGAVATTGDGLEVIGIDTTVIGETAAQAGIAIFGLRTTDTAQALEDLFLQLTGGDAP